MSWIQLFLIEYVENINYPSYNNEVKMIYSFIPVPVKVNLFFITLWKMETDIFWSQHCLEI